MSLVKSEGYSEYSDVVFYRRGWFLVFLLLLFLVVGSLTPFVRQSAASESNSQLEPLDIETMRVVAYTKAFATRFGLPMPEPGFETPDGLEAVEFSIERGNPWSPYYYSNLRLYVDSTLPIQFPEDERSGDMYLMITKTHFFGQSQEQFMKWPVEDRRYFIKSETCYTQKAFLATMNYGNGHSGQILTIFYKAYRRNIFPGVDYIHTRSPQAHIAVQDETGVGIWLKRVNDVDYGTRTDINQADFIKFRLPDKFYKQLLGFEVIADNYNDRVRTIKRRKRK